MHAGWGDKYKESPRTAIDTYVAAVDRLLADRPPRHPSREVPIFVVTEDYTALEAFQQAVVLREGWVVYTHPAAILQASTPRGADAPTGEKRKKNEKKHKHENMEAATSNNAGDSPVLDRIALARATVLDDANATFTDLVGGELTAPSLQMGEANVKSTPRHEIGDAA